MEIRAEVTRRRMIGGLAATLVTATAGSAAQAQEQSPPARQLQISGAPQLSLTSPSALRLLQSSPPVTRVTPGPIFPADYVPGGQILSETVTAAEDERGQTVPIQVMGQQHQDYAIYEKMQEVATIGVEVLLSRRVKIEVMVNWAFVPGTSLTQQQGWSALVDQAMQVITPPGADGLEDDLVNYLLTMSQAQQLDVSVIALVISTELVATSAIKVENDPVALARRAMVGQVKGTVLRKIGDRVERVNAQTALPRVGVTYELIGSGPVVTPAPTQPPTNVTSTPAGTSPDRIADTVAKREGGRCEPRSNTGAVHEIMKLFAWPEFKVEWGQCTIRFRRRICRWLTLSFSITVPCPHFFTRTATLTLFSFVRWGPMYIPPVTVQQSAVKCSLEAALLGAVIGTVLSSPLIAAATYKGAFWLCMAIEEAPNVNCLVPGIAVDTTSSPWRRI